MSYNSDVRRHITAVEHSKFVEIVDDVNFPAVTAVRVAYPESSDMPPVTSVDVYPKHAVLTVLANANDISVSTTKSVVASWDVVFAQCGSSYVAFPSTPATTVNVVNNTGTSITLKKTTGTVGIPLPDRSTADIEVVSNANEISLKRTDGNATPVSAYGIVTLY